MSKQSEQSADPQKGEGTQPLTGRLDTTRPDSKYVPEGNSAPGKHKRSRQG